VPAVRPELRLVSELARNRPDRAAALIAHLRSHGADLGLLQRAMTDRGLAPDQQRRVLDGLNWSACQSLDFRPPTVTLGKRMSWPVIEPSEPLYVEGSPTEAFGQ